MRPLRLALLSLSLIAAPAFTPNVRTAAAQNTARPKEPVMLSAEDQKGVRATYDALLAAWNHHDMTAYGDQMTDDCEWVNVVGMHWVGRAQVVKAHRAFHATMFKDVSLHEVDTQISAIAPGVALVLATTRPDDYTTPSGQHMTNVLDRLALVMVKTEAGWRIRYAQNTTVDENAAKHDPGK